MTDSVIGALRVVFGADTVELESALNKTAQSAMQINQRLANVGAMFGRVGSLIKGALVVSPFIAAAHAVNATMQEVEALGDAASSIGIPVERLTELKHAAESSGASLEALTIGMKTLARNMGLAFADGRSVMAQTFAALGVSIKDASGRLRDVDAVMSDVAERMSKVRDGTGKTAVMMQLFGEQGSKLTRMLNTGAAGLKEMADEARKLGIVVGADSVASAQRYNAAMDRLGKSTDALRLQVTNALAPSLERLSYNLAEYAAASQKAENQTFSLGKGMRELEKWGALVAAQWSALKVLGGTLFGNWDWSKAVDQIRQLEEGLKATEREIDATPRLRGFAEVAKSMKEAKAAVAEVQGAMQRLRDEFNFAFADPWASVETKTGLLTEAFKKGLVSLTEYRTMLRQLQVQDLGELRAAAKATLEDTLSNTTVSATRKMELLTAAVKAGTLTFDEFNTRAKEVTKEGMKNVTATLETFSSGMADAFSQFTESGKVSFRDMTASIMRDLAKLIFQVNVLKPLFGDGGSSSGLVGDLAKSAFAGLPGFATGGRPQVGMPSWVGERGRELFVPDTAGTIIPNSMIAAATSAPSRAGAAPSINLSIDARGATVDAVARLEAKIPRMVLETVKEAQSRKIL